MRGAPELRALDVADTQGNARLLAPMIEALLPTSAPEDVEHLGVSAYVDLTRGVLVVAANKRYAFSVAWHPASVTYGKITNGEAKKLIKLAKDIVKRVPK